MKKITSIIMVLCLLILTGPIDAQIHDKKILKIRKVPFVSRIDNLILNDGHILSQIMGKDTLAKDTLQKLVNMGLYDYYPPEFNLGNVFMIKNDTNACIFALLYIDNDTCIWTDKEILSAFPKNYKPATATQLLEYGQFLSLQDNIFHIAALGDSLILPRDLKKRPLYPRIDRRFHWRNLSYAWCDKFDYHTAFLAIKPLTKKQLEKLLKQFQKQQEIHEKERRKNQEYDPAGAVG